MQAPTFGMVVLLSMAGRFGVRPRGSCLPVKGLRCHRESFCENEAFWWHAGVEKPKILWSSELVLQICRSLAACSNYWLSWTVCCCCCENTRICTVCKILPLHGSWLRYILAVIGWWCIDLSADAVQAVSRVVSSETSGGKFPEIYSNLSRNFRKFFNYLCPSAVSESSIAKWCCKKCMFLTNNSPDLYALTICVMFRKNNLFLARLPGISANSNENYRRYNLQAYANISGKFPEILNFRKIPNPSRVTCLLTRTE